MTCPPRQFYDKDSLLCRPCAAPCPTCSNPVTCDTCDVEDCICKANQITKNCVTCLSNSCAQCAPTYILQNSACTLCPEGCKCNEFACLSCEKNYFFSQNTCTACDVSCDGCTAIGPQSCNRCNENYGIIDGKCQNCVAGMENSCKCGDFVNCAECGIGKCESCRAGTAFAADGTCTACADGFFLNSDKNCERCGQNTPDEGCTCGGTQIPFCQQCEAGNATCGQCLIGKLFIGGKCVDCPEIVEISASSLDCPCDGAVHCGNCAGSGRCRYCLPGYYELNRVCVRCEGQIGPSGDCVKYMSCQVGDCADCYENQRFCRLCKDGFQLGNDGRCYRQCQLLSTNGHYCDVGSGEVLGCNQPGQKVFGCVCGDFVNCEACDLVKKVCVGCIKGYAADVDGNCTICDVGWRYRPSSKLCYQDTLLDVFTGPVIGGIVIGVFLVVVLVILCTVSLLRDAKEKKYRIYKIDAGLVETQNQFDDEEITED